MSLTESQKAEFHLAAAGWKMDWRAMHKRQTVDINILTLRSSLSSVLTFIFIFIKAHFIILKVKE